MSDRERISFLLRRIVALETELEAERKKTRIALLMFHRVAGHTEAQREEAGRKIFEQLLTERAIKPERLFYQEIPELYDAARDACHYVGLSWTDPRTGVTYPPPGEPDEQA